MIRTFLYEMDMKITKLILCHIKCFIPSIIATLSSVIFPSFISKIIDEGISKNDIQLIFSYWIEMLICGIIMVVFNYIQSILYCKFEQELYCELKNKALYKILHIKSNIKNRMTSGDLYKSIDDDLSNITSYLTVLLPELIMNVITLIGVMYIILKYYSMMGLLILVLIFVLVFSQPWFGKKIEKQSFRCREMGGREASLLQEIISNAAFLNMMGYSSIVLKNYFDRSKEVQESNVKFLRIQYIAQNIRLSINTIALLITLIIGTLLVSKEKIGVGVVLAMTIYIQRVSGPLNGIVQNYLMIKSYSPYLKKMLNICTNTSIDNNLKKFPKEKLQRIVITDLTYAYSDNYTLFSNFNLEIVRGDILGIVGGNGTGKSTLIKIIMKCLSIEKGKIFINSEYELQDLDEDYLYQNISVVPQTTLLLTGKLIDILNPTKKKIEDKKIVELLNRFTVDYSIFNYNLNYEIAEKGINISGGEAQKISLVRMAIEDKPWVILDEPTSAMDNNSEKEICYILKEYLKGRTAIIITHRPEILKICNKIIELDKDE